MTILHPRLEHFPQQGLPERHFRDKSNVPPRPVTTSASRRDCPVSLGDGGIKAAKVGGA